MEDIIKTFKLFCRNVKYEDEKLNKLFNLNNDIYKNYNSYGIDILPENVYVYIFFKAFHELNIKKRIAWENPYSSNKRKRADISIYDSDDFKSVIEFKIWYDNKFNLIAKDIDKLSSEESIDRYLILIKIGGEPTEIDIINNIKYLKIKDFYKFTTNRLKSKKRIVNEKVTIFLIKCDS